jgi:hypothetical protein
LTYNSAHPLPLPPPERPPGLQLVEICYNAEPIIEALQWLVPDHTLRIVNAKAGIGTTIRPLFMREGKYLRSVRFLLLNPTAASLLALCPNLEELDINGIVPLPLFLEEIVESIPPSIQHLRVRASRHPSPVLAVITRLTNLQILTLPRFDEEEMVQNGRLEVWEEIERVCTERSISIVRDSTPTHLVRRVFIARCCH